MGSFPLSLKGKESTLIAKNAAINDSGSYSGQLIGQGPESMHARI
jgi:hypothetical protein